VFCLRAAISGRVCTFRLHLQHETRVTLAGNSHFDQLLALSVEFPKIESFLEFSTEALASVLVVCSGF
jgi:hypothetical protein